MMMGDDTKHCNRALNPWVLHLQKLGLELKCPLCLELLKRPLLLPCDHIFCDSCISRSTQLGSECPVCKIQYAKRDLRLASFMENIISIYKSLDAAFCANLLQLQSTEDVSKKGIPVKCSIERDSKDKRFEVPSNRGNQKSGPQNVDLPSAASLERGTLQVEMNKVDRASAESPPSFDGFKCSDNGSSGQGTDQSSDSYLEQVKRNSDSRTRQERYDSSTSETEEAHLRDAKRQKKLNFGSQENDHNAACQFQSVDLVTASLVASNSESEPKSGSPLPGTQLPVTADDLYANKTTCAFCQSSRTSEATGKMLHYSNGNPVAGDHAFRSNVIHVHSTCIEWAPRVYYEGESVKNLKAELARGAKLKCTKCGLKGAALGCYVRSCRRNYHVPCAREMSKCRWDYDDFLLLCPAHSSVKLPKEKSRTSTSKNDTMPMQITSQESSFSIAPTNKGKEWVLCGSALSSEDKFLLVKFASMIGATVTKFWNPNITHVIAATDEHGACIRTLKVLMAISNGKWVLKIDWIKACMEAMRLIDEEQYEVSLDNHGCRDGPKTGRLRALDNAPKLFNGFKFYFSGDFMLGYKEDLQNLIIVAGGTVLRSKEQLVAKNFDDEVTPSRTVVIYNLDSPQGSVLGEEVSVIWQRLNEAEDLATKTGSMIAGHTWLLESIAAYKLQPLVR